MRTHLRRTRGGRSRSQDRRIGVTAAVAVVTLSVTGIVAAFVPSRP